MDILTHTLSGVAVGTLFSGFSNQNTLNKSGIILVGGIGGAFPDIDANSLWSGFDGTIGKLLNLSHSGNNIYFSKYWYSHHGFFHSLLASIIFGVLLWLLLSLSVWKIGNNRDYSFLDLIKSKVLFGTSFILSYLAHLFEDMITPGSVWGGVNFFFPSERYIGGLGKIWWWNNYDIFLIVCLLLIINLTLVFAFKKSKKITKIGTIITFSFGLILILIQINTRGFDFDYEGHTSKYYQYELKSKEIQKKILGNKIYNIMEKLDNKIKFYF